MSNAHSTQNDWFKSQQQYWDMWFQMQRNAFGVQPEVSQGPWADFFKEWQRTVAGGNANTNTDAFQQYFAKSAETFMNMMQQFYPAAAGAATPGDMARQWTETLHKFFSGSMSGGKDPFSTFDPMGFYASMPGLGYTREKQEELNRLYQQWSAFESKMREYNSAMSAVGLEAVQKFQEYLANPPKDAAPLKSLKEIYTKWVDVCEAIYAKYAMSEEYTELYGEVVNALMAFKQQQNKVADEMLEQFNMPTRREIDSLHKQVHDLKRELAAMRKGTAEKTVKKKATKKK